MKSLVRSRFVSFLALTNNAMQVCVCKREYMSATSHVSQRSVHFLTSLLSITCNAISCLSFFSVYLLESSYHIFICAIYLYTCVCVYVIWIFLMRQIMELFFIIGAIQLMWHKKYWNFFFIL